jgi:endonuclease/exonuclease/phosphatase family metal-dependent hydrolase
MKKLAFALFAVFFAITASAQELKVMSYNIHHGANAANIDRLDSMAMFIKESGADLIGLQEVDSVCKRSGNIDQMKRLGELTGMYFAFVRHLAYDGGAYGQGLLSRYPIADIQNHRITLLKKNAEKDSRALLSVMVTLPGKRKVSFSSVHFALDAESRMIQSEETINYLKNKKIPVILTGDLNSEPDKPEILNLQKYFATTDKVNLLTYPEDKPKKKIDYIFVNKDFLLEVKDLKTFNDNKLSDHLPIMCTVTVKQK